MKKLFVALLLGLGTAIPALCRDRVLMPEPGMVGELAVAAVGFVGLVFLFRKKNKS